MKKAVLPGTFHPVYCDDLIRLGRDNDGGYLANKIDVLKSDLLISFGINDDWSFEEGFHKLNPCPVHAYDDSVNHSFFFWRVIRSVFMLKQPSILISRLKTFFNYRRFFSEQNTHVEKFVGIHEDQYHTTLATILKNHHSQKCFFKIDIEGWEYRIIDDLIKNVNLITGLVIEFHDCDLHLARIENFISDFDLKLVHVHANNYSPVNDQQIPLAIELTFSRYGDNGQEAPTFPHPLDMPNTLKNKEIEISFSNLN